MNHRHLESLESRRLMHGEFPLSYDFAPKGAAIAGGTEADIGLAFGTNGGEVESGWNIDSTANAVARTTTYTPYQRSKTFIDMQKNGNRTWEMHVDPGKYSVTIGAGDPTAFGGKINITAEGKTVVTGTATSATRLFSNTLVVTVTDGKLTIGNGTGATWNKISYVKIDYVGPLEGKPPAEPTPGKEGQITWKTVANAPVAQSESFGGVIGGKLYIFGGFTGTSFKPTNAAYSYDPATGKWATIKSLPVPLTHVAHAEDGKSMYFAGGYPGTGTNGAQKFATTDVWRYDPSTNSYTALKSLPEARGAGAMALVGRKLYYMGGNDINRKDMTTVYSLDLDNQSAGWTKRASLPKALNHPAAIALNGSVYFISGQTSQDAAAVMSSDMYKYDPTTDKWTKDASLPIARSHITSATFIWNGQIVALGGEPVHNQPVRNVDVYNPVTGVWKTIGQIPAARFSGVGGLLDDGSFIYTTGYTGGYFMNTTWIGTIS